MTFGESPYGSKTDPPRTIIEKIKMGNSNFSKLAMSNPLVGFRWLEAVELIKRMTISDHAKRPSPDQLVNDIFFKDAQERKTILISANDLLNKNPSEEVMARANRVVTHELVPKIHEMRSYHSDSNIPSFKNWNEQLD